MTSSGFPSVEEMSRTRTASSERSARSPKNRAAASVSFGCIRWHSSRINKPNLHACSRLAADAHSSLSFRRAWRIRTDTGAELAAAGCRYGVSPRGGRCDGRRLQSRQSNPPRSRRKRRALTRPLPLGNAAHAHFRDLPAGMPELRRPSCMRPRLIAVLIEASPARRILSHLGEPV